MAARQAKLRAALCAVTLLCGASLVGLAIANPAGSLEQSRGPERSAPRPTSSSGPARRVVSLVPNVTEMLFAVGAGSQVVGVTQFCDRPPEAKSLPKVADYIRVDAEKVLQLKPDLVIGSAENSSQKEVFFLMERGVSGITALGVMGEAPKLDAAELEREKLVILSELGECLDAPDDLIHDHLFEAAFGEQALARPVLGNEKTINSLDRNDCAQWLDQQYRPERLVVSAAGKVDPGHVLMLAEALFGDLQSTSPPPIEPAKFVGGIRSDRRQAEQTHLALAWQGVPASAARVFPW